MKYEKVEELELQWATDWLEKQLYKGTLSLKPEAELEGLSHQSLLARFSEEQIKHDRSKTERFFEEYVLGGLKNNKLQQALRARRKRLWNKECKATRITKKSVDLEEHAHAMLSHKAKQLGLTLSETIEYILSDEYQSQSLEYSPEEEFV